MTDRELAGCPLCGEPAEWSVGADNVHNAGATCKLCGLDLWDQGPGCMDRVTESWNRRAPSRDAERYRWLRENADESLCIRTQGADPVHSARWAYYQVTGKKADAAIDAAIAAADRENHG